MAEGMSVIEKGKKARNAPAADVDSYLAAVPEEARAALEKLRKTIKAAAPKADEVISYQIPTYKHYGPLVGFAAFPNHCGFYVMSPAVMDAHRDELESYDTSKGTIRFQPASRSPRRWFGSSSRRGSRRTRRALPADLPHQAHELGDRRRSASGSR
jgi:uncharacterized protein YdhG (YjbR/CyaY superfamily)